jgi:DNA/RNA-binding domain of Phe-tRNA-synthetase-like protein
VTLVATEAWRSTFPGAAVGALVMREVSNPERSEALEAAKRRLEGELRALGEPGPDAVLRAYVDYYRAHGKTYHVKAQWESVAVKGKPIPSRAALVEAMFMAELEDLVLTAGHDVDAVAGAVRVDATADGDRYELLNGSEAVLRAGDMMMADGTGIISSVLRGPDRRTSITPGTRAVLFTTYAPAGVGEAAVRRHLERIEANVRLIEPDAYTEDLVTLAA